MNGAKGEDHEASQTNNSHHCKDCNYIGRTVTALRIHFSKAHMEMEKKPLGCDFPGCDFRTTDKSVISKHRRRRHAEDKEELKVHACSICNFRTFTKAALRDHVISHSTERPFVCDLPSCSFQTKTQAHLDRHRKLRHHPNQDQLKVHSCNVCGFRCREKGNLVNHMRTHTGDKPYVCEFPGCQYRAAWRGNLHTHRRTHNPQLMLKCDFSSGCEFQTPRRADLEKHRETHNQERKREFGCSLCPKKFTSKKILRGHISGVHTRETRMPCNFCDLDFSTAGAVRMHTIKAHAAVVTGMQTILKSYKCTVCDYSSTYKPCVRRHQQRTHSSGGARKFECDNCEYRAKFRVDLVKHQRRCRIRALGVRSFRCELCPKKYFTIEVLRAHLERVHRPDKRFKCEQCEFGTNYKLMLQHHVETQHVEESTGHQANNGRPRRSAVGRPVRKTNSYSINNVGLNATSSSNAKLAYKCQFPGCNYQSTANSSNIQRHKRRHRPEMKNFACSMCPRKFFERRSLKIHIRCHVKEKPFKCDLCEYASSETSSLRTHKQTVHRSGKPVRSFRKRAIKNESEGPVVSPEQLRITSAYSCPFCRWGHAEYMSVLRHTVGHRSVVVSLERVRI